MKIAGLFGKTTKGDWVTLATPDVPLVDQKLFLKQLKTENGRSVMIGNERADLTEAVLFVSGSGKWVGFKQPAATIKSVDAVTTLDVLAEALGISRDDLDEIRKLDRFPAKEKDGYNVAATREFFERLGGK